MRSALLVLFIQLYAVFSHWQFAFSQNPLHRRLSIEKGFFSNTIYDIYQDKKGFIWLATEDGLVRYDGLNYKEFPIKGNKSSSVSNILETSDGRIWVQNFSGQFFYTKNDSLIYKPEISVFKNFMVGSVLNGKTIAVFTTNGIRLFNVKTNTFIDVNLKISGLRSAIHANGKTYSLYSPQEGVVYEINHKGTIQRYPTKVNVFSTIFYTTLNTKKVFASKLNDSLFFDSRKQLIKNKLSNSIIQNIAHLSEDELCVLTTSGFILVNKNLQESRLFFSQFSCSKAIRDNEGNLWVGTINDGVIFIPHTSTIHYLENQNITSLFVSHVKKTCLIGTKNNEIYSFNMQTKKLSLLLKKTVNHEIKCLYQNPFSDELIYCSEFVYHLDKKQKLKKKLLISANHISLLDKQHYLLSESNTLTIYPINKNDPWLKWKSKNRQLSQDRLNLIGGNKRFYKAFYHMNKIIAHSADGLWEFTSNGERKLLYREKAIDILDIEQTKKGILVMTGEHGVLLYDGQKLKPFISQEYFQGKRLHRIQANRNQVCVVTYSGFEVFDFKGNKIMDLLKSDGFPGIDVVEFDLFDNHVFTANVNGFVPIYLDSLYVSKIKPRLVLNAFSVNQNLKNFQQNTVFGTTENSIQFRFSVLDFRAENTNQIYYAINGKEWTLLNGIDLNLSEMQYGKYQIRVKAQNARNQFSNELVLHFEIDTPYHKEFWFILLVVLGSLFVIGLIVWLRFREIRSKNRILQEKMKIEKQLYKSTLSSIKSQMNPHFLFNALNTIQSFIYTNDRKTASSYLVSFSELTRMILDMSNRELVSLSEEIEALNLYLKLEKMRFEDHFIYEVILDNLPHQNFQIPSMLIQPYVENAIKHGLLHKKGERKLQLLFDFHHSCLQVQIKDNGIGIEASQKINKAKAQNHESFATKANQKRFEILNQLNENHIGVTIKSLESGDGKIEGTLVTLSIPVN